MNLINKKALVMGLGLYEKGSGISAVKFLLSKGANITVTDLKTRKDLQIQINRLKKNKNFNKIKFVLGKHNDIDFSKADLIVKNPGVPKDSKYLKIARKNNTPVYNDITLFLQEFTGETIGVTGTRGKSTTVSLLNEIFKTNKKYKTYLGGNIKISPLQYLNKIKNSDLLLLEISSWQANGFKDVRYSPQIAVVLNIMNDHMNMYSKFSDYVLDKSYLYKYQSNDDYVVFNKNNSYTRKMASSAKAQVFWVSLKNLVSGSGAFKKGNFLYFRQNNKIQKICGVNEVGLLGEHNLYNVLAAICVAKIKNISIANIKKSIKSFKGIDSRLELIREYRGVKFYNDTTATTPDACIAALNSFDQKVILIAGGMNKNLEYNQLAKNLNKNVKKLILFPGSATDELLSSKDFTYLEVADAENMQQAVDLAFRESKKGDIILLSPAAASFNMFKNEFDRGEQFVKAVKKLS